MKNTVKFEVCAGTAADAYEAYLGGADRVELNSALFLGGLTPSVGELEWLKRHCDIPAICMLRPREGGFCYSNAEYETMLIDAEKLISSGADGIVFGFLNPDSTIDKERTKELVALAGDRDTVFSRAIDLCPDIEEAVSVLSELGVTRILTSGGKPSAILGKDTIKSMIKAAKNTEILPGGGLNITNVTDFVRYTGVSAVHASARKLCYDRSAEGNPEIFFGGKIDGKFIPENEYKLTDREAVEKMKATLSGI